MTGSGIFPKIAGDVCYSYDINRLATTQDYARLLPVAISTGSGTVSGCWVWTTTGSTLAVTDEDLSTWWAGSFIGAGGPVGPLIGSIVIDLGFESYRRGIIWNGSVGMEGTFPRLTVKTYDNNGSLNQVYAFDANAGGFDFSAGSFFPINGVYKTRYISTDWRFTASPGSMVIKLWDIKVV